MSVSKMCFVSTLLALLFALCLFSCSSTAPEEDVRGLNWDSMAGSVWYIQEGNGRAMERWTFYKDSLVGDIDHYGTDSVATYRERHVGRVCTKDQVLDYYEGNEPQKFRCTELQWKRMTPSLTDPTIWTPVYDWSVYQAWSIEYRLEGLACVGETPNCYEISKVPVVRIKYPEGWVYDQML